MIHVGQPDECSVCPLQEYGSGRMLTGDVKKRLIEILTQMVQRHQQARALVTEEVGIAILVTLQRSPLWDSSLWLLLFSLCCFLSTM